MTKIPKKKILEHFATKPGKDKIKPCTQIELISSSVPKKM